MAIQYKRIGKHGALVSNLCLGTMNFGWVTDETESFRIMDRALELGINFFDTADVYGWGGQQGDTELIIGRWFAQGGGRRDAVILATKVFNPVKRSENRPEPNADGRSLSAVKIMKHCAGSLSSVTVWRHRTQRRPGENLTCPPMRDGPARRVFTRPTQSFQLRR